MGAQRDIPVGESIELVIERIRGDLRLAGWQRGEVSVRCDDDRMEIVQEGAVVRMNLRDDSVVQVPANSRVVIQNIEGDASITSIYGGLTIQSADGDLSIRDCGALQIEKLDGDLSVSSLRGDCRIGIVSGDATFSNIAGSLVVESISDDLQVSGVSGNVKVAAGDDVSVRPSLQAGTQCEVRAGGDLSCRIPADANVSVRLECGGEIRVRRLDASVAADAHHATFNLGTGGASLTLTAGEDITVSGTSGDGCGDFNWEMGADFGTRAAEFAQTLATQLEAQMGAVARQLDEKFATLGSGDELATRIQEKIQSALRRAEERAKEYERRGPDFERHRGRAAGWPPPPQPPRPPRPPAPPVSEDERLMILRMVSEGKISVEQAEKLLSALYGRGEG
jgi:hypothetical protein